MDAVANRRPGSLRISVPEVLASPLLGERADRSIPKEGRAMNSVQRRLFRAFVESGGDLTHEAHVDRLIQHVNANVWVMPPKVKRALQLALHADDQLHYGDLAERLSSEEGEVSEPAFRQRVSRGVRALESVIRARGWMVTDAEREAEAC
jgi:hypothetical protein